MMIKQPFNESMLNFDVSYDQQRQMTLNDRIYIYIYIDIYVYRRKDLNIEIATSDQ